MKESNSQKSGDRWGNQWTSRSDAAIAQERAEKRAASERVVSPSERWRDARPSKSMIIWASLGAVALTLLIGFQWGGWQTARGAASMASTAADAAVVEHLAPICVTQFQHDPARDGKLLALQEVATYQRAAYVTEQQWATMPGADAPVAKVADACARLILQEAE